MATIQQLAEKTFRNYRLKPTGWAECSCPFCNDTKRHLQITPNHLWARCFRCSTSVPIEKVFARYNVYIDKDKLQAIPAVNLQDIEKKIKPIMSLNEGVPFAEYPRAVEYIKQRNALDVAMMERWMYAVTGKFQNRVVIPIKEKGNLYGLQGRTLNGSLPKYLFSDNFKSNLFFYHYDYLFGKRIFILTEGVFDCISVQKALPYVGVVALFGKHLSKEKAYKLAVLEPEEVVIMLDSEPKDKEIQNSILVMTRTLLSAGCGKISLARLKDKDPNESDNLTIQTTFYNRITLSK